MFFGFAAASLIGHVDAERSPGRTDDACSNPVEGRGQRNAHEGKRKCQVSRVSGEGQHDGLEPRRDLIGDDGERVWRRQIRQKGDIECDDTAKALAGLWIALNGDRVSSAYVEVIARRGRGYRLQ